MYGKADVQIFQQSQNLPCSCIDAMKQTMDLVVKRVKRVGPLLLLRNCQDVEGIFKND